MWGSPSEPRGNAETGLFLCDFAGDVAANLTLMINWRMPATLRATKGSPLVPCRSHDPPLESRVDRKPHEKWTTSWFHNTAAGFSEKRRACLTSQNTPCGSACDDSATLASILVYISSSYRCRARHRNKSRKTNQNLICQAAVHANPATRQRTSQPCMFRPLLASLFLLALAHLFEHAIHQANLLLIHPMLHLVCRQPSRISTHGLRAQMSAITHKFASEYHIKSRPLSSMWWSRLNHKNNNNRTHSLKEGKTKADA